MTISVRNILDTIDEFLVDNISNGEGGKLWDVLTALRGPDDESDWASKYTATGPIRAAAFPRFAEGLLFARSAWTPGPTQRYPGPWKSHATHTQAARQTL